MNVYLVNESTVVKETEAFNIAWAINYQAQYHFGRSGWRGDVRCYYSKPGASIPAGSAILHLLDSSDTPGALGYHDEDGTEVPFARVFAKTALDGGNAVCEVASHELLELAADPNLNLCALSGDGKRLYAVEVGDPVQGNAYDIGVMYGRTTGYKVADFTLPNYYDPKTPASTPTSFRGAVTGPFSLAAQGYCSYLDMTNVSAGWQQKGGAERASAPPADADDRLTRRTGYPVG